MLNKIFKTAAGLVKDVVELTGDTAIAIKDDLSEIPKAVADGYNNGCFTAKEEEPLEADGVTPGQDNTTKDI